MRDKRVRLLAGAVALVLAGGIVSAIVDVTGVFGDHRPLSEQLSQRGLHALAAHRAVRFSSMSSATLGDEPFTLRAEAVASANGSVASLLVHMSGFVDGTARIFVADNTVYGRVPDHRYPSALGNTWVSTSIPHALPGQVLSAFGGDVPGYLRLLSLTSRPGHSLGGETIDGTALHHYRFLLDARRVLHSVPPELQQLSDTALDASGVTLVPYEVWFDKTGMLRKAVLRIDLGTANLTESIAARGTDESVSFSAPATKTTGDVDDLLAFYQDVSVPERG